MSELNVTTLTVTISVINKLIVLVNTHLGTFENMWPGGGVWWCVVVCGGVW